MIEYKFYTMEEFNNLDEDIKWDVYSEIANELKRKIRENERQYNLLKIKQDAIINLKEILYEIIDYIGSYKGE